MTTPFESAMAKLAAIAEMQNCESVVCRFTPSEAAALRERLEWRPIETAPVSREGILIVGGRRFGKYPALMGGDETWWREGPDSATHWQPLPEPPND